MGLKNDGWIRKMAREHGMIEPFEERQVAAGGISFGLSSYGYDLRVSDEFRIFTSVACAAGAPGPGPALEERGAPAAAQHSTIVDPKRFDDRAFVEHRGDACVIPPNSFALGRTVEYLRIPRGVLTICLGKSTYARCGIIVNVTPFEPEWEGHVTVQISNTTPLPARVYAGEGIAQAIFFEADEPCEVSYADRKGKYQGQRGITLPRL